MKIAKDYKLNSIDISNQFDGYEIVDFKITYESQIMILGKNLNLSETEKNENLKVLIIGSNCIKEIIIKSSDSDFSHFDILPDNEIVLAFCRASHYGGDNFDKNLKIFDFNGNFKREFLIGDGIQDLQTNSKGEIWTSYFDEGIFNAHRFPNSSIGKNGLVCWNKFGEVLYQYTPPNDLDYPSDCYALNVLSDNAVWISYHGRSDVGFHIVKIKK